MCARAGARGGARACSPRCVRIPKCVRSLSITAQPLQRGLRAVKHGGARSGRRLCAHSHLLARLDTPGQADKIGADRCRRHVTGLVDHAPDDAAGIQLELADAISDAIVQIGQDLAFEREHRHGSLMGESPCLR